MLKDGEFSMFLTRETNKDFKTLLLQHVLFICLLLTVIPLQAQETHPASSGNHATDSARITELIWLSQESVISNPQNSLRYAEQALAIARTASYIKGEAAALAELANILHQINQYDKSIAYYKESIRLYHQLGDESAKARNIQEAATVYASKTDFSNAQYQLTQALDIYNMLSDDKKISEILKNITLLYQIQGGHHEYQDELRQISTDGFSGKNIVQSLRYMGLIYFYLGNYNESLKFYLKALEIADFDNNKSEITLLYNSIGILYKEKEEYDKALEFYLRALKLGKFMQNRITVSVTLKYIGLIYEYQGQYDKAANYYLRSINIAEEIKDSTGLSFTYLQLGNIYVRQQRHDRAFHFIISSLKTAQAEQDHYMIASSYLSLGRLYMQQRSNQRAEFYFLKSVAHARYINAVTLIREAYGLMSDMYAASSDFKNAYKFSMTFSQIKDSIYNIESSSRFKQLQSRFELDSKQKEIDVLRKNYQINQLIIEKQNITRNFLIVGILLVSVFLALIINRFNITRRQKKLTDQLNEDLKSANFKLSESERNLLNLNATKDKFFSIISHDLRNPFAAIISFSRLLRANAGKYTPQELDSLLNEFDTSIHQVNALLENLLHWSRSQLGSIQFEPEVLAVREIADGPVGLLTPNAKTKGIRIINQIPEDLDMYADKNMVDTVIRNLVSNAVKYTRSGGEIRVKAEDREDHIVISIEDTGVGISPGNLEKMFRIDGNLSTRGTSDEKGTGLGLILCREFIEKHNGRIWVESTVGEGSRFSFSLPYPGNPLLA
jgi:signal transduction histidine kinase